MSKVASVFTLSASDRTELQGWLRKTTLDQRASRAFGVGRLQVVQALRREGLAGLVDLLRPGQQPKLTQKKVQKILTLTTQRIPAETTHWSLRLVTKHTSTTVWQVSQGWEAADLKPHRLQAFKSSNDPQLAENMVDMEGLCMNPPEDEVVPSISRRSMHSISPGCSCRCAPARLSGVRTIQALWGLKSAFCIATAHVLERIAQRHPTKEFLGIMR